MREYIRWFFSVVLFWLLIFLVQRISFQALNYSELSGISFKLILESHWRAIPMDLSIVSYMLIPIVALLPFFHKSKWFNYYLLILLIISSFLLVVDAGLYQAWGSKLNRKALSYMAYPEEVMFAVKGAPLLLLGFVLACQIALGWWVFNRFIKPWSNYRLTGLHRFVAPGITIGLLIIGIRGGVQTYPINKSWSFFCRHQVLNLAAVNSTWNAFELLAEPPDYAKNPYRYFEEEEADRLTAGLISKTSGSLNLLNIDRPNIVLVFLESWSVDVIEPLGGESGVSDQFSRLAHEGLLLTNFYSTGFRTEQGLAAVISGFPSQPMTTIIRKFGKFDKLPSLLKVLGENGYSSKYYYAGDAAFANTMTFLKTAGFQQTYSEEDFGAGKQTDWGAYDEELFAFILKDKNIKEPFFHFIMTSTSHEPFDAKVSETFKGRDLPSKYRNTIHYTDSVMGDFFMRLKQKSWYRNTLFIIMPDHGHYLPLNRKKYEPERHHIPMLLLGPALRVEYRGRTWDKYGSHVDVATSLLAQLKMDGSFKWGKDLFDPDQRGYAFYSYDEGFGWITKEQGVVYDHQLGKEIFVRDEAVDEQITKRHVDVGKAYLQEVMQEYIGLNQ